MQEIYRFLVGVFTLFLGFIIGDIIKKQTADEQKIGKKWFRLIVIISIVASFLGLFLGYDWILFTFAFFAIVTSRSLK